MNDNDKFLIIVCVAASLLLTIVFSVYYSIYELRMKIVPSELVKISKMNCDEVRNYISYELVFNDTLNHWDEIKTKAGEVYNKCQMHQ